MMNNPPHDTRSNGSNIYDLLRARKYSPIEDVKELYFSRLKVIKPKADLGDETALAEFLLLLPEFKEISDSDRKRRYDLFLAAMDPNFMVVNEEDYAKTIESHAFMTGLSIGRLNNRFLMKKSRDNTPQGYIFKSKKETYLVVLTE